MEINMNLEECYAMLEGDYGDALGRLYREEMLKKFVLKFLDDPSYDNLCKGLEEGNGEEAFRAAHTIKGVCQNLSFNKLYESSMKLTEALRNGIGDDAEGLFETVRSDYEQTASAIRQLKETE